MITVTRNRLPDTRMRSRTYADRETRITDACIDPPGGPVRGTRVARPSDLEDVLRQAAERRRTRLASLFLGRVYDPSAAEKPHKASDLIFEFFRSPLTRNSFDVCNRVLAELDTNRLTPTQSVAVLSVTLVAKSHLAQRSGFYARALETLARERGSTRATQLLSKYR